MSLPVAVHFIPVLASSARPLTNRFTTAVHFVTIQPHGTTIGATRQREDTVLTKTITALYDSRAIHPDEPLPLPRDTRLTITVHADEGPNEDVGATIFLDVARSLSIDGTPDWSARIDHPCPG